MLTTVRLYMYHMGSLILQIIKQSIRSKHFTNMGNLPHTYVVCIVSDTVYCLPLEYPEDTLSNIG